MTRKVQEFKIRTEPEKDVTDVLKADHRFVDSFLLTVTGKVQKFKIRTEATRLLGKDVTDV